jgi:hypothetical protein
MAQHAEIGSPCLRQDTKVAFVLARPSRLPLMILLPALLRFFCHHQPRLVFDYTSGHHDDQGQLGSGAARLIVRVGWRAL